MLLNQAFSIEFWIYRTGAIDSRKATVKKGRKTASGFIRLDSKNLYFLGGGGEFCPKPLINFVNLLEQRVKTQVCDKIEFQFYLNTKNWVLKRMPVRLTFIFLNFSCSWNYSIWVEY